MKSILKVALVASFLMVLLFAAQPSMQQQEETPRPGVFLGNLIQDMKSLGLIKSSSLEKKKFTKEETKESITNLARMVRYLLVLKGQGKDEEVAEWVNNLKLSKKFSRAARMVRITMRQLAKKEQQEGVEAPKYVVQVKDIVNTVMTNALSEMKSLLQQAAETAEKKALATKPVQAPQPTPDQAHQAWEAVEQMAHKMVEATNVNAAEHQTAVEQIKESADVAQG